MPRSIVFLSLDQILTIHAEMLALAGGQDGILKQHGLESAIASPQATYGGAFLNAFPFEMAAAYLVGFTQNHAFVDGNKRVAAAAAAVFLELNRWRLGIADSALSDLVLAVARGDAKKPEVARALAVGCDRASAARTTQPRRRSSQPAKRTRAKPKRPRR